jgi:hypothetical protein
MTWQCCCPNHGKLRGFNARGAVLNPHGEEPREAWRLEPRGPDASPDQLAQRPASFETRRYATLLRMRRKGGANASACQAALPKYLRKFSRTRCSGGTAGSGRGKRLPVIFSNALT